jgi:hypothetical protein
VRDYLTGVVGMNLILLQLGQGIKSGYESDIIGAFRADYVDAGLKVAQLRDPALHAQQFGTCDSNVFCGRVGKFEQNDMGDHDGGSP